MSLLQKIPSVQMPHLQMPLLCQVQGGALVGSASPPSFGVAHYGGGASSALA